MPEIFTVGYQAGWTPELLQEAAAAHDATVVDVRLKPWSKDAAWRKSSLERSLGRYRHIVELGNLNYRIGGKHRLMDSATGIAKLLTSLGRGSVILLCGCWGYTACHRVTVADLLVQAAGGSHRDLGRPPKRKSPQLDLFA